MKENINIIIAKIRIDADSEIIVLNGRSFNEIRHDSSGDYDLIFMGLAFPDDNFASFIKKIQEQLKNLPTIAMVLVGVELSFGEVLMQQGQ